MKQRKIAAVGVRQVAALAGVSAITVCRALAEPERVAAKTRERVDAAVKATGYIPNRIASSFASNVTRMIAAVVPTLDNSIAADFIEGMLEVIRPRGYQLLLGKSNFSIAEEETLVREFIGRRADGIYLTGSTHTPGTHALLRQAGTPTVEIACLPQPPIDLAVGFSNAGAAYAMTRHLALSGRRRIALFTPLREHNDRQTQRLDGYRQALAELGLDDDKRLVAEMPMTLAAAAAALRVLLGQRPDVDALFCTSDVLAVGALFECQRRGLAVPGALAIAGFEDMEIAACIQPPLTTVRIPRRAIGQHAGALLLARIAGEEIETPVVDCGFELVIRDTA